MGQILTGWMAGLGLGVILGNILVGLTGKVELVATFSPLALWAITGFAAARLAWPWHSEPLGYPAAHGMDQEEAEAGKQGFPPELKTMAIGLFLQNLAFGSLILAFNFLAVEYLQLNRAQFGLMFLLGGAPAVLLLGPMGKISDRIGRRNSVIRAMLVVAPMIAAAPFLHYLPVGSWGRFAIMVPGLLIAGVAYAFLLPAWHALALGRIPEQQRGRSLALLMSIEMAALASGHVVGPFLYEKVRYYAPFVFAGITFAILAGVYQAGYILPPETPEEPHPVDVTEPISPNGREGNKVGPPDADPLRPSPRTSE